MKYTHFASTISKKGQLKEKHYFENNSIYVYKISRNVFFDKFYTLTSMLIFLMIYLVSSRIQSIIFNFITSKFINNINMPNTTARLFVTQSLVLAGISLLFYFVFILVRHLMIIRKIEQSNVIIKMSVSEYKEYIFEKMSNIINDNTLLIVDKTNYLVLNQNENYMFVYFFMHVEFEKLGYKRSIYLKYMPFILPILLLILPLIVSIITTDNDLRFHYQLRVFWNLVPFWYVGTIILIREGNFSFISLNKKRKILQKEIFKEIIRKKEGK